MKISKKIYNMYARLLGKEENSVEKEIVVKKEILTKIDNLNIEFLSKTNIKEIKELFNPFISNNYNKIFFKELVLEHDDFPLFISSDEKLKKLYSLLEEFDKKNILYKLISRKSERDEYGSSYYDTRIIKLSELRNLTIEYDKFSEYTTSFDFTIFDFALSADGKYLATATERNIFIWCAKSYRCLAHHIAWDGSAEKIYFTPDSKYLIALINDMGSGQNTIQVWKPLAENVEKWEWIQEDDFNLEYTKHTMKELNPSLEYLFSSLDSSCYGTEYNFYREFYSYDFTYKVSCDNSILTLFDKEDKVLNTIPLLSKVRALVFSYDSKYLCVAQEKNIELLGIKGLGKVKILESHKKQITALATSRDNKYLISASLDQTLKIWSLESFELLATIESGFEHKITAIDFSSDSKQIFASSKEGMNIWDMETKKYLFHCFNDEGLWCRLDSQGILMEKGKVLES